MPHDFVASTIVGATSLDQLMEALPRDDFSLSSEVLAAIDEIDVEIPNPMTDFAGYKKLETVKVCRLYGR